MSWCGGGEIRPTPGVEWRTLAMVASTLWPGNCPPSPGLAPCAILICITSELTRYSAVTPKRPEATCLIAERIESPFGSGLYRSGSSPPSPDVLSRLDLLDRHRLAAVFLGPLEAEQPADGQQPLALLVHDLGESPVLL